MVPGSGRIASGLLKASEKVESCPLWRPQDLLGLLPACWEFWWLLSELQVIFSLKRPPEMVGILPISTSPSDLDACSS